MKQLAQQFMLIDTTQSSIHSASAKNISSAALAEHQWKLILIVIWSLAYFSFKRFLYMK